MFKERPVKKSTEQYISSIRLENSGLISFLFFSYYLSLSYFSTFDSFLVSDLVKENYIILYVIVTAITITVIRYDSCHKLVIQCYIIYKRT